MSRGQLIGIGVALVVAVIAGVLVWQVIDDGDDGGGSADEGPTFVIAPVERRDLADEITVRGEIRRDELQRLTPVAKAEGYLLLWSLGTAADGLRQAQRCLEDSTPHLKGERRRLFDEHQPVARTLRQLSSENRG